MALVRFALATASAFVLAIAGAAAAHLPSRIAPLAPFPTIVTQAPTVISVAPGVQEADYMLWTVDGPIAIHVVAVDPHRKDLHISTVLAADRMVSTGERVSAMAARTGAVAGINGDYFDINATNAPTNVVIDGGHLLRTPRNRAAFVLEPGGDSVLTELSFSGSLQIGSRTTPVALNGINELPPPNRGISLITPAFGVVPPSTNTLVALDLLDGTAPFARYRAGAIVDNTTPQPQGSYLAIAAQAYSPDTVPNPGDVVTVSGDLAPIGIAQIAEAVGGGPVLLRDGQYNVDPDGPNGATFDRRIPTSAIATASDGTLFLIEVDGRQPHESIGLLRPQLAALMIALGARNGMALDGGGSSTLVAREPGDVTASLLNSPSDGVERRVGDALLVYSDAPVGPASSAVVTPETLRALVGSSIRVTSATIDASGHRVASADTTPQYTVSPTDLGAIVDGTFVARRAGRGELRVAYGPIAGQAPIVVSERPARLELLPNPVNLAAGARVHFSARALDADGFPLPLPAAATWTASSGTIGDDGTFTADAVDAIVTLQAGGTTATQLVTVGQHEGALALRKPPTFASAPRGGPGSLDVGTPCAACIALHYDFTGTERAAYANIDANLPDGALGIAFDVDGDGSGAVVRVTFVNAIDETFLVTATTLDFNGRHRVVARVPSSVGNGAHVASIYVINGLANNVVRTAGTIVLSNLRVLLAGSGP